MQERDGDRQHLPALPHPRADKFAVVTVGHYNSQLPSGPDLIISALPCAHLPRLPAVPMNAVAIILATSAIFSLALLVVLGSLLRLQMKGVHEWFYANLTMVVALPLLALRGNIPDLLSIIAGNVLIALASAFYYAGCARFLDLPTRWPRLLAGLAAHTIALVMWRYLNDNPAARVVVVSAYNGLLCLLCGRQMLHHRPRNRNAFHFFLSGALSILLGITHFIRGGHYLVMQSAAGSPISSSLWNIGLLAVGALVIPTLTMQAVLIVHDTLLARMEDAINHDHLTAALSRKRFESVAQTLLKQAGPDRPVSLLLMDLDHFKRINDSLGHAAGDEVLRAFVQMAQTLARPNDALGRLGGEEFGLLLPDTTLDDASIVAERLRSSAERHLVQGAFGLCHYTLSIGVACAMQPESMDWLSARADGAMYIAKNSGRNRIAAAPPETSDVTEDSDAKGVRLVG
jgi:diguanylate cyclase (GGDEF)-like protein